MIELKLLGRVFAIASMAIACSSKSEIYPDAPGSPSIKITKPHEGDSFVIAADSVDVEVDFDVEHFDLVSLGQEGTDMSKGQVRLYVDGDDCNDPGEPGEPAVDYNKIYPNDHNEKHVGMDYCAGGALAVLDNKTHTFKAQLWHGAAVLAAFDQITFKTTVSAETRADAATEPADGAAPAAHADGQ